MREGGEGQQKTIWVESEGRAEPPEVKPGEPVPKGRPRFQPINRQQMVLRMVDVEQLLEPDHLARAIWEMTGRLDLTPTPPRCGRWKGRRDVRRPTRAC
jgi:hypothetical protein